jgi:Ras GTPase-activating-like protein IQGAP2/3
MDAKIGLLAHNKIASDEAARLRHQPNSAYRNTPSRDSFNSRALNKNSRTKLDRYQELFFILQTQPQFLARLLRKSREQGATEADMKRLESLVMSTFAHAQKQREEYYLLKLFSRSIEEEIGAAESLQHFRRGNYCFDRLFNSYTRVPRDRKFIRQAFGVWIKEEIVEATGFDLETDPLKLYRAILDNEQLNTGRTTRDPNMSRDMAIQEQDVRDAFIGNLQYIREHVERFLELLEDNVSRLPYGARYMTKQMFDILSAKCPGEDQHNILQVAGFWLWKMYIKPSLADPEGSGLVDRGLDVTSKRNLNVILHVLNQVAIAKLFGQDQHYLRPLNALLQDTAIPRLQDLWAQGELLFAMKLSNTNTTNSD